PEDTIPGIREHLDVLRGLKPHVASFYILTPIPGTEQYDDFLEARWITEPNLDRYDATNTTWKHPNVSSAELGKMLYHCYNKFYSTAQILHTAVQSLRSVSNGGFMPYIAHPLFSRFSSALKTHPMSGGFVRARLDSAADYRELRRTRFGYDDNVPLPRS